MAYDEELADRLRFLLGEVAELSERRMFGGLAFLVGDHLAVSASGRGGLMVRVDPAEADDLVGSTPAARMVMKGREMDGWLILPLDAVADDEQLRPWVDRGVSSARSLPPKGSRPRR